jgi:hypothetical protein
VDGNCGVGGWEQEILLDTGDWRLDVGKKGLTVTVDDEGEMGRFDKTREGNAMLCYTGRNRNGSRLR